MQGEPQQQLGSRPLDAGCVALCIRMTDHHQELYPCKQSQRLLFDLAHICVYLSVITILCFASIFYYSIFTNIFVCLGFVCACVIKVFVCVCLCMCGSVGVSVCVCLYLWVWV